MTVSTFSQAVAGTDTLSLSVTSALSTGTYSISGAVDNRPTSGSVVSYDLADLWLVLSAAVTPTLGDFLTAWGVPSLDGTNYASPGSAAQPPASLPSAGYWASPVSTQYIPVLGIPITPDLTKILIQTNLTPTITITSAILRRRTGQSW